MSYLHNSHLDEVTCGFVETHIIYAEQAFKFRNALKKAIEASEHNLLTDAEVYAVAVNEISETTYDLENEFSTTDFIIYTIAVCEFTKYIHEYLKEN